MKIKKYLASANTGIGFVNKFDNINNENNSFCYIIKGGPGTGKSSLMKQIGKHFEKKGYNVEYFYCSSDATSLDGIRIKNISIVDGTAPHVTEANLPSIDSKIINVGEFIERDISSHRKAISKLQAKKSQHYKNAYSYFSLIRNLIDLEKPEKIIEIANLKQINNFNFTKKSQKHFRIRTLFSSFVGENGLENLYSKNNYKQVIFLKGNIVDNAESFKFLTKLLKQNNESYTQFMSILNPLLIEAILIKSSNTLFVSEDAFNSKLSLKNSNLINSIIKKISKEISQARLTHKKIESYFIPAMNFKKLSTFTNKLIIEMENFLINKKY